MEQPQSIYINTPPTPEQPPHNAPQKPQVIQQKPPLPYSRGDGWLLLLAVAVGYLFAKLVMAPQVSMGFLPFSYPFILLAGMGTGTVGHLLFAAGFVVSLAVYIAFKRKKPALSGVLAAAGALALAASQMTHCNGVIHFLTAGLFLLLLCYAAYAAMGHRRKGQIFSDILYAAIVTPFSGLFCWFGIVKRAMSGSRKGKRAGHVAIGLLIALPVTVAAAALLVRADAAFSELVNRFFSGFWVRLWSNIGYILLGFPVALFAFGLMYNSAHARHVNTVDPETTAKTRQSLRIAPPVITVSALTPVMLTYLAYFAVQFAYFTAAFASVLPQGYNHSEFARRGFFELCAVAGLNLVLLLCAMSFSKKTNTTKHFNAALSVFTLAFIGIAVSKMVMYIESWGFTRLRVYTTWFMTVLAVLFVLLLLKQYWRRLRVAPIFIAAFLALYALLAFGRTDAAIASLNVEYYGGEIATQGEVTLDAAPYIWRLVNDDDRATAEAARLYLHRTEGVAEGRLDHWLYYNIAFTQAADTLNDFRNSAFYNDPVWPREEEYNRARRP